MMYFKKFEDLTFADHYMFEKVLQNAEICQELLERLLKIQNEKDLAISAFLQYICNQKPIDDFTEKLSSIVEKIKKQEVNRKEYYQKLLLKLRRSF